MNIGNSVDTKVQRVMRMIEDPLIDVDSPLDDVITNSFFVIYLNEIIYQSIWLMVYVEIDKTISYQRRFK